MVGRDKLFHRDSRPSVAATKKKRGRRRSVCSHHVQNVWLVASRACILDPQPLVHTDHVELVSAVWIVGLVNGLATFKGLVAESAVCLVLAAFNVAKAGTGRHNSSLIVAGGNASSLGLRKVIHRGGFTHFGCLVAPFGPGATLQVLFQDFVSLGGFF